MISLDWTLGVSAAVFLATLFALNHILFKPLFAVLEQRRQKTSAVLEQAVEQEDYQEQMLAQYHQRIREEQQAGYRVAEANRQKVVQKRSERVAAARTDAESMIQSSREQIHKDVEAARRDLEKEARELAGVIADRLVRGD